jgi:heme exporter protein B
MKLSLVRRDLRFAAARGSEGAVALFFFLAVASLFPFALGSDAVILKKAGPGVLWVSALLSALLSLEAVWHRDFEDGTIDLLLLSGMAPLRLALSKILSHWAMAGLPLVVAAAVVSQMFFLPPVALCALLPSLLLGTLYMSLLGSLGAVLTFGARRPGLLLVVLVLPLFTPMLILGVTGAEAALDAAPYKSYLLLQLSLVVAALGLVPFAGAKILETQARS